MMFCEELSADLQPSTSSHNVKRDDEKIAENIQIDHIVALAWTAPGSRKVRQVDYIPRPTLSPSLWFLTSAAFLGYFRIREGEARVYTLPWC